MDIPGRSFQPIAPDRGGATLGEEGTRKAPRILWRLRTQSNRWADSARASIEHSCLASKISEGKITLETDGHSDVKLRDQGDRSLSTPEIFRKRRKLRRHHVVLAALERWWRVGVALAQQSRVGALTPSLSVLRWSDYWKFYTAFSADLLDEDYDADEAEVDAREEWERTCVADEVEGGEVMQRTQFIDGIFELADVYTPHVAAEEYAGFLDSLLTRVCDADSALGDAMRRAVPSPWTSRRSSPVDASESSFSEIISQSSLSDSDDGDGGGDGDCHGDGGGEDGNHRRHSKSGSQAHDRRSKLHGSWTASTSDTRVPRVPRDTGATHRASSTADPHNWRYSSNADSLGGTSYLGACQEPGGGGKHAVDLQAVWRFSGGARGWSELPPLGWTPSSTQVEEFALHTQRRSLVERHRNGGSGHFSGGRPSGPSPGGRQRGSMGGVGHEGSAPPHAEMDAESFTAAHGLFGGGGGGGEGLADEHAADRAGDWAPPPPPGTAMELVAGLALSEESSAVAALISSAGGGHATTSPSASFVPGLNCTVSSSAQQFATTAQARPTHARQVSVETPDSELAQWRAERRTRASLETANPSNTADLGVAAGLLPGESASGSRPTSALSAAPSVSMPSLGPSPSLILEQMLEQPCVVHPDRVARKPTPMQARVGGWRLATAATRTLPHERRLDSLFGNASHNAAISPHLLLQYSDEYAQLLVPKMRISPSRAMPAVARVRGFTLDRLPGSTQALSLGRRPLTSHSPMSTRSQSQSMARLEARPFTAPLGATTQRVV